MCEKFRREMPRDAAQKTAILCYVEVARDIARIRFCELQLASWVIVSLSAVFLPDGTTLRGTIGEEGRSPRPRLVGSTVLAGILLRTNPDHDPWRGMTKRIGLHDCGERHIDWLAARFHEIDSDYSVLGPQNTRTNFDNTGEGRGVANCAHAFWAIPGFESEALCPQPPTC